MSLILEALKKLEREKQAPERGVVVVGAASLSGARGERRLGLFLLGLAIGAAVLGGLALLRQPGAVPEPPAPVVAAAGPAAPPAPVTPSTLPPSSAAERLAIAPKPASAAPPATPRGEPVFTLQAISERDGHPVAVVNERLLREGDSIDGARIVRIAKDEVELDLGGRRLTLRF